METATAIPEPARPAEAAPRVAMFVYNSCASDARVLKEAATLTQAGYRVTIYAVLDRENPPLEDRDGIRIVRIDRRPVHLRLRDSYRRVRARIHPFRLARRLPGRARSALGLLRAAAPLAYVAGSRLAARCNAFHQRRVVRGLPGRTYRYLRWRVLQHVPPLRRFYYRRRASRRARSIRARGGRRLDAYLERNLPRPQADGPHETAVAVETMAALDPVAYPRAFAPAVRTHPLGRAVGRRTWRAIMLFHKPLNFVDYYRRAYARALAEGFDAIHAHDLLTLPVGAALARKTRKPLVYDAHELYTEMSTLRRSERLAWRYLERRDIGRATRLITVCDSIAGELVARYGVGAPTVLLNCPPAAMLPKARTNRLRERLDLEGSPLRLVLYQGGLVPNRGLEELVEASASFHDAVLVLMGWGRSEQLLRNQIELSGLAHRVLITDPVPQAELLSFTCGADVGVIPYKAVGLNNYYTTPNKLFEYLSAGIPVACSRFPELRRFVERTGAGLTFDPSDPDDIALAVNGILADDAIRGQMREAALRTAGPLTWERQAEKLVALYAELELSSPPTPAAMSAGAR